LRNTRWDLIIAVVPLAFVSVRWRLTGGRHRASGGLAIMIMHQVNSGAGVRDIRDIGGLPVITGTKNAGGQTFLLGCHQGGLSDAIV
jgi:hypothetical protein